MKKKTLNIFLAVLCLNVAVNAQNKALSALEIGDKVPDITITNIINYIDTNGKPASTAKLSDFKGKLLILDFWATWCSPCVAMIPKMDSLQQKFGSAIQFLPVTYQSKPVVTAFMGKLQQHKKKLYNLPDVTSDTELAKLFPHSYLPHYVWIDKNGIVKAITEYKEVTTENISKFLQSNQSVLREKKDPNQVAYDFKKPFLVGNNGGEGNNILFHSLLTNYAEGLFGEYHIIKPDKSNGRRVVFINVPLIWLYKIAYGGDDMYLSNNRILVTTSDSLSFNSTKTGGDYIDWLKHGNGYCYELQVPTTVSKDLFKYMREDLLRLFSKYQAKLSLKKIKCLALVRTSTMDKLKSNGGKYLADFNSTGCTLQNQPIEKLVVQLNAQYLQNSPLPVVNDTNYTFNVDLDIDANLSNIKAINMALEKYDLKFVEKEMTVDVLIISDN